jgi:hypothetical protein
MNIENTYLIRLYRTQKKLFAIVTVFILFQLFFTIKGVETLPFFNYGMYSAPVKIQETYKNISLYNDEKRIPYNQAGISSAFIGYQLNYYDRFLLQDSSDYVKMTIESRFGKGSKFSNYLTPLLTNEKSCTVDFLNWLDQTGEHKAKKIYRENYQWVKNNFKIINKEQIH